jgi:hypothetical protein
MAEEKAKLLTTIKNMQKVIEAAKKLKKPS